MSDPAPTPTSPAPSPTPTPDPAPQPPPTVPPTAPAPDLDALVKELEKANADGTKAGKADAERTIAERLGMDLTEVENLVKAAKDEAEANKTEEQKARQKAEADAATAKQDATDASIKNLMADVKLALVDADVKPDRRNDAAILVEARLRSEATIDESVITKAVGDVKTSMPECFGAAATAQSTLPGAPAPTPSSTPAAAPPAPAPSGDALAAGIEAGRLAAKQPHAVQVVPR